MNHKRAVSYMKPRPLSLLVTAIVSVVAMQNVAAVTEFEFAGAKGSFKADVTVGTQIRNSSSDPVMVNNANSTTVGFSGNTSTGTARNNDDGNLNFKRGDTTSTVVKALFESSLKGETFEGLIKAKAWYDYIQSEHGMPYGNIMNGYVAGATLGESGSNPLARASGISLLDAYVKGKFEVGSLRSEAALGNQTLAGWGERFAFGGGLSALLPRDLAAAARPGALPGEVLLAIPMVSGKLMSTEAGTLEAFYQLGRAENVLPLCGTFASPADFLASGCDKVFVGPGTDASRDAIGQYVKRTNDEHGSNSGQYGIAYRFKVEPLNTQFALNYANYSSRTAIVSTTKSTAANPLVNGDPNGSNVTYFLEFPDDIRVFGGSFNSQFGKTTVLGEFTYRPNQPISLNGPDILNAFVNYAAPTPLRTAERNTAPGQAFHGFDRFKVSQMQLAATRTFENVLGAQDFTAYGEVAMRHVNGLPDENVMRYGRPTLFGMGPVNGVCQGGSSPSSAQCSSDGYVTSNSWGYRLRATARYPGLIPNTVLIPTIGFWQDVKGWSDDGAFSQGRKLMSVGLRALFEKKYWVDATAQSAWGGNYDVMRDRDFINLSVGASF
jgi:Protein of unknown function (DUF1302)